MNKPRSNTPGDELKSINEFIEGFQEIISAFSEGAEAVMTIVTGSFDRTEKRSEEISELFGMAKSEAEAIFSIFSGIASIFLGGGGGILDSILGLIPGGGLINSIIGQGLSPSGLPLGQPNGSGNFPAARPENQSINIHVHTQLEKPDAVKLGKMISEEAGLRKVRLFTYNN